VSVPQASNRWVLGGGAIVLLVIALPLWNEFRIKGQPIWNAFLAAFLIGLGVSAILLQRFFRVHAGELGEARFDTRNQDEK
jgi:hypothetical protein